LQEVRHLLELGGEGGEETGEEAADAGAAVRALAEAFVLFVDTAFLLFPFFCFPLTESVFP
jgi:hypothetical protein